MIETVFTSTDGRVTWIDVTAPSREELERLAKEHELHETSLHACLDPEHLPKLERIGRTTFLLLRAWDQTSTPESDTLRAVTRKLAIFQTDRAILTVHRAELPFLTALKRDLPETLAKAELVPTALVVALVRGVLETYEKPTADAEEAVEHFEEGLFQPRSASEDVRLLVRELYVVKRRVNVIRWVIRHTMEAIQRLQPPTEGSVHVLTGLRERSQSLYFSVDELLGDINNLLNVQLALAAHRTSEVMRVLTIFSVFFMPLTFIVGVYGMNFEHFPELKLRFGYAYIWLLMLATCGGIFLWFRKKGWLR